MRIGRAFLASLGIYIITFILSMIAMVIMGVSTEELTSDPGNVPVNIMVVAIVITTIVAFFGAKWYFKKNGVHAGIKEGFLFGIILTVIGFVLDGITLALIPGSESAWGYLQAYIAQPSLWIGIALILASTTLAAVFVKQK